MKKLFGFLIISLFLQNCSFDNKTGIWKNENNASNKDKNLFEEFEKLSPGSYDKFILNRKLIDFNMIKI